MTRRRDRHFLFAFVGVLLLYAATCVVSLLVIFRQRSFIRHFCAEVSASVKASEKASVEAATLATTLYDSVSALPVSVDAPQSVTRIVGYGQSRTKKSIWIYADIEVDGVVHREYIQSIPLSQSRENSEFFSQN